MSALLIAGLALAAVMVLAIVVGIRLGRAAATGDAVLAAIERDRLEGDDEL